MTYTFFAYKNKEGKWLKHDGQDRIGGDKWTWTDDIDHAYIGRPPRGVNDFLARVPVKVTHFVRQTETEEKGK